MAAPGWRSATHIWSTRERIEGVGARLAEPPSGIGRSGARTCAGIAYRIADLDRTNDRSYQMSGYWLEERERTMEPKKIGAARFKEQCLNLIEGLTPEGLVITRRGRPVARVLPYPEDHASLIGSLRDKIRVRGEIMATGIRWDADGRS